MALFFYKEKNKDIGDKSFAHDNALPLDNFV